MNLKTVVPLCAAGVLGLAAAIVASQLVRQRPVVVDGEIRQQAIEMTDVVVAARDLVPGAPLTAGDLAVARFDAKTISFEAPHSVGPLLGRVMRMQIPKGQVIHPASMLADTGVPGGLAAVIPTGLRAMTLEVNEFTGVAGLVEPGNRIDILARVKDGEGQSATDMTRTIVQDVQVLAVGQTLTNKQAVTEVTTVGAANAKAEAEGQLPASKAQPQFRSVTVLVTPQQAERLDLALGQNPTMAVRMALRSPTDHKEAHTEGATLASLRDSASNRGADFGDPMLAASKQGAKGDGKADAKADAKTLKPADDVFGTGSKPTFKPAVAAGGGTRSVTVIRAGVATQVEVEDTLAATPAAAVVPAAATTRPVADDVLMSGAGE